MTDRPYVTLSCAMSIDGYLDSAAPGRLAMSNAADLDRVDEVRARQRRDHGRRIDRPPRRPAAAGARAAAHPPAVVRADRSSPSKVTVTASGDLPPDAAFFTAGDGAALVYSPSAAYADCATDSASGRPSIGLGEQVTMAAVLDDLGARRHPPAHGRRRRRVLTQFLEADLVDELQLVIAPFFVGESRAPRVVGRAALPVDRVPPRASGRHTADRRRRAAALRPLRPLRQRSTRRPTAACLPKWRHPIRRQHLRDPERLRPAGPRMGATAPSGALALLVALPLAPAAPRRRVGTGLLGLPVESLLAILCCPWCHGARPGSASRSSSACSSSWRSCSRARRGLPVRARHPVRPDDWPQLGDAFRGRGGFGRIAGRARSSWSARRLRGGDGRITRLGDPARRRAVRRHLVRGTMVTSREAAVWVFAALAGPPLVAAQPPRHPRPSGRSGRRPPRRGTSVPKRRSAADPVRSLRGVPADRLLAGLRGKDVVVVFVESYGRVALEGAGFSPGVTEVLRAGDADAHRRGIPDAQRVAHLAHLRRTQLARPCDAADRRVDRQQSAYDQVVASDRLSLARVRPRWLAHRQRCAVGHAPLGVRHARSTATARCSMPTTSAITARRSATPASPTSTPGILRRPRARAWASTGHGGDRPGVVAHAVGTPAPTGAVVADRRRIGIRLAAGRGSVDEHGLAGPDTVQAATASRSSTRSARCSRSCTLHDPNLVLVVLGDHQPATIVSGERATHDVPISIIAKDPAVFHAITGWRWQATAGSSLLLTDARCADATCTFTVDFTGFSRLRTSAAPSRVNAARTAPQDQIPERAGPRGWRTGVTAWSPQPRSSP